MGDAESGPTHAWYTDEWDDSVAFRAEQQRETSRPLPGTPSVEEQDTGPYGLVDASYLYEDCYKSQEDDDNSFL